jgi:hypothetical protein
MDKILSIVTWMVTNYKKIVGALLGFLTAIMTLLALIPGDQGESKIQPVITFLNSLISSTPQ